MRKIFIWTLIVLGVGGIIFGLAKFAGSPASLKTILPVDAPAISDWTKGGKDAKVILVEYSDFQCPACGAYYSVTKQLVEEFGGNIAFIYRHFPLRQIHQNAELAARAAESAGKQGKFWEIHDIIFENQEEWSSQRNAEEFFERYAKSLDLNMEKFKSDLVSKEIKDEVAADYQSGLLFKVNATPTFFLNGEKLQNPRNYEEFKSLIQAAISQ
ncbi:MAG: DsbA family protein [Patescibacteria group bacterium]